jgi:outer membrane lipoprotein SlyB
MKHAMLTAAMAGGLALSGCATTGYGDPYYGNGNNSQGQRAAQGGILGAATGAAIGAVVPGVSAVEGAVAGGIAGAVLGAVINGRQYYRDTRGSCYYVDQYGRPIYDNSTRC